MAMTKAGVVYVDVELSGLEKLKREIASKFDHMGREAGKNASKSLGDSFSKDVKKSIPGIGNTAGTGFMRSFSDSLRAVGPVAQTAMLGGLLTAAAAMAPLVGAALGGGIVAAIGSGVIGAGIYLAAQDPRVKAAGAELGSVVREGFLVASRSFIPPVLQSIEMIRQAFLSLQPLFKNIFGNLSPYVTTLTRGMIGALTGVTEGIEALSRVAGPIMKTLSGGLAAIGIEIGNVLKKFASDPQAMEGFREGLQDIITILVGLIRFLGNTIAWLARTYASFKSNMRSISSTVSSAWNTIKSIFNSSISSITSRVSSGFSSIVRTVRNLPGQVLSALSSLPGRMAGAGVAAVQGLIDGLRSMIPRLLGIASNIASSVIGQVSRIFDIGSPSKVFYQIGQWNVEGLVNGMQKMMPQAQLAMDGLAYRFPNTVKFETGSPREPLFDSPGGLGGPAIHVDQIVVHDNEHPWRTAENLAFMFTARGY